MSGKDQHKEWYAAKFARNKKGGAGARPILQGVIVPRGDVRSEDSFPG